MVILVHDSSGYPEFLHLDSGKNLDNAPYGADVRKTFTYTWSGAVTNDNVILAGATERIYILSIQLFVQTAATIAIFDNTNSTSTRFVYGVFPNATSIIIPFPSAMPCAANGNDVKATADGGAGSATISYFVR